ncbi:dipeptide/oligopeptide/nickel ABC transporter permease/ATP-binding protein [Glutamicibacter arilaitensis]|uniref:Dipeptide/oligopeptide/nickel ABC transporter permease/ATP-binding protein n=1 Tax=Glutamicibacter arilaitensis TaxID=256701 RepID=A0A4Y8U092_9MICC|nr:dipeptide/oligopeptide/nickel ABC transporter permease/ATP-binding protein [Glutamicibacter arilaitensis]TFH57241.1 dipeptide/oligopeptide/nickel ABC transporter permease/ATP-binding protein [Glutamicibacter arilaitensis]
MSIIAPRNNLATRLSDGGARFKSLPAGSKIALAFLLLIAIVALFAPLIAPHDPLATGIPAQKPSGEHFFGTDRLGRDIYSRLLFGAQASLLVGLGSVALALVMGGLLGALAATSAKWANETIMRIMDMVMAFPGIALAAALLASLGNTLPVIILSIAIIYTPQIARVVRANVLAQWGEDYVRAERVIGAGRFFILGTHVVRNCAAPVMVFATVMVADAIILEASLSFLGAGIQDPAPSWGNVISYGRTLVLNGAWWATTFAGLVILLTVLALNMLAEGMTDALVNTKGSAKKQTKKNGEPALAKAKAPVDPQAAGRLRAELDLLATAESKRSDRLVLDTSGGAPRTILEVKNLSIRFPERYGDTEIVQNVSFAVREGETMALVGESGCGKSITSLAIMGLLPKSAKLTGSITFEGTELLPATADGGTLAGDDKVYKGLRGEQIAMVYQDALSSLNPSMLIGDQLRQLTRRGGRKTPEELLTLVKLDAKRTLRSYPHELSGGQRQRVLIAMALSRSPKLVVCDEPTTALDVTVQKQVVDLLNELREQLGFAMVFVSHDLALVASLAHRVTVMYAGQVVESGPISDVLRAPHHEYTQGLLGAVLSIESQAQRLHQIPGTVPSPYDFAAGDRFAERSARAEADPHQHLSFIPVDAGSEHRWASHQDNGSELEGANK